MYILGFVIRYWNNLEDLDRMCYSFIIIIDLIHHSFNFLVIKTLCASLESSSEALLYYYADISFITQLLISQL